MKFHRLNLKVIFSTLIIGYSGILPAQKTNHLPANMTLSFNGTFQTLTNKEYRTTSENGIYKVNYNIGAVSDEMRELNNLQVYKNDQLLFTQKKVPGSDMYISNAGMLAIIDMSYHFRQQVTVHFYQNTGKFIMKQTFKYASLFGFSPKGEKFIVGTDKNLNVIDLVSKQLISLETGNQFAFSQNEHYLVTAREDHLFVYFDYKKIATYITGFIYPRGVAVSNSGHIISAIDKTYLKVFSLNNEQLVFEKTLTENKSFRSLRMNPEGHILAGVHYRYKGTSTGILHVYDTDGNMTAQDNISTKIFPVFEEKKREKKISSKYETIPWPFIPFDQVHKVWNHYEQHMGDGSGNWAYLHQGLDIEVPVNEPTYAVEEGWVKLVLTLGGDIYWRVAVCPEQVAGYADGWLYAHLVPGSIQVEVGDYVNLHDYLGDIIYWSDDWGHIHFVEIHDHGTVWYYDDDEWGINFNPLLALDPITDNVAPVIENFSSTSKFGFCINETSNYLNPNDLHGDIDIIVKISDYHGDSEWEQPAFKTYYWFNKLPENITVFPKTLGQILNHSYTYYSGGYYEPYAPLIYKKDNAHPSPPWMNEERNYFQILTNNNGDSIADISELQLAFPTAQYPDGIYRLFVEAWDEYGNMTVDSMDVTFDNFTTGNRDVSDFSTEEANCYPNPAKENTSIVFTVPADNKTPVKITLYDASFRMVKKIIIRDPENGKNNVFMDLRNIKSGIYFIKIETENQSNELKLIIL